MSKKEEMIKLQIELTKLQMQKNEEKQKQIMERLEKKKEIAEINRSLRR